MCVIVSLFLFVVSYFYSKRVEIESHYYDFWLHTQ